MGYDTANFVKGSVQCSFKDDGAGGTQAQREVDVNSYIPGAPTASFAFSGQAIMQKFAVITCGRDANGFIVLKVKSDLAGSAQMLFTSATTLTGNVAPAADPWGKYVTLGKKPESDNPADAFAGWMDYVVVAKSAP